MEKAFSPRCAICGTLEQLLRCGKCKTIYYCSAEHQHMNWPTHKQECRRLAKQKNNNKMLQLQQAIAAANLGTIPITTATTTTSPPNSYMSYNNMQQIMSSTPPIEQQSNGVLLSNGLNDYNGFLADNGCAMTTTPIVDCGMTTVLLQPTTVILGTNENLISNSQQTESSLIQNTNNDLYYDNLDLNNINDVLKLNDYTFEELQQEINQFAVPQIQQSLPEPYAQQQITVQQLSEQQEEHLQQQPPLYTQYSSNHKQNQIEKSSSYQIGRGDKNFIGNANERRYEELCNIIINDMNQYGLSVVDDFLGMEKGTQILNEVRHMHSAGVFKDGQLVNNVITEQDSRTIRGDKIAWVKGGEAGCANVGHLINQIDAVIYRANTMKNNGKLGNYNIKERTKAMVACYPGSGSHYKMHVDNPNKDGRVITAIYYLNVDWDTKNNGGVLRIFPEHCDSVAHIEPKFDRLIFFWSDKRNPHEVQPAHRTRYAITVWYFDANERETALNRCRYNNSNKIETTPNTTTGFGVNNANFNTNANINLSKTKRQYKSNEKS